MVAVIYTVPLLCEALDGVFDTIAEMHTFPARGDTPGLLRSLQPDAILLDSSTEAEEATEYARETETPLVHILLRERRVRLLRDGGWSELDRGAATAEGVRNIVVAALYGRQEVA